MTSCLTKAGGLRRRWHSFGASGADAFVKMLTRAIALYCMCTLTGEGPRPAEASTRSRLCARSQIGGDRSRDLRSGSAMVSGPEREADVRTPGVASCPDLISGRRACNPAQAQLFTVAAVSELGRSRRPLRFQSCASRSNAVADIGAHSCRRQTSNSTGRPRYGG